MQPNEFCDGCGGLLASDRVGIALSSGAVVLDAFGGGWPPALCGFLGGGGADGAAGDGVRGEEEGCGASFVQNRLKAFGEGLGEERFVGPAGDEVVDEAAVERCIEGALVEAG